MKRLPGLWLGAAMVVFSAACSSSHSSGNSAGGAGTSGSACSTNNAPKQGSACSTCLKAHCNSDASGCYGSSWASGSYSGGSCSDMLSCETACACGDTNCAIACGNKTTSACITCSQAVSTCQKQNCNTECASTSTSTGGAAGAGSAGSAAASTATCADLAACCASSTIPQNVASSCTSVAQNKNEMICGQTFSGFKSLGYCK